MGSIASRARMRPDPARQGRAHLAHRAEPVARAARAGRRPTATSEMTLGLQVPLKMR